MTNDMLSTAVLKAFADMEGGKKSQPAQKPKPKSNSSAKKRDAGGFDKHETETGEVDKTSDEAKLVACLLNPALELTEEHRLRMGRWRRDVAEALADPLFKSIVTGVTASHNVLEHFMNFLTRPFESEAADNVFALKPSPIAELVTGRLKQFVDEFSHVFTEDALGWADDIEKANAPIVAQSLLALVIGLNCHHAGAFHRRIAVPLSRQPFATVFIGPRNHLPKLPPAVKETHRYSSGFKA